MKVAVVGLGVMGLSAAWRLSAAGHSVVGFDRYPLGHANGSSHGDTRIFRGSPGEGAVYRVLAKEARAGWEELEALSGHGLIEWSGALIVGPKESAFVAASASQPGMRGTTLHADEISRCTGGVLGVPDSWIGALQDDAGVLSADRALQDLSIAAESAGAELRRGVRVEVDAERGELREGAKREHFDRIVVAAGPWIASLVPSLASRVTVTRKTLAWFRTRRALGDFPVVCLDDPTGIFAMPTADGLLKLGQDAVGETDDLLGDGGQRDEHDILPLIVAAHTYFPGLDPAPVQVQGCRYTSTPDQNFIIADLGRVLAISCCSGHGFKYAPSIGRAAACWVDSAEHAALSAFAPGSGLAEAVHLGQHD